jgi:hypothetical protein
MAISMTITMIANQSRRMAGDWFIVRRYRPIGVSRQTSPHARQWSDPIEGLVTAGEGAARKDY